MGGGAYLVVVFRRRARRWRRLVEVEGREAGGRAVEVEASERVVVAHRERRIERRLERLQRKLVKTSIDK